MIFAVATIAASALVVAIWLLLALCLPRAVAQVPRAHPSLRPSARRSANGDVNGESPLVSVIVPARNEEALLGRCLASLAAQDYPALDVVVVDDHSTDGTRAIAERTARVIAAQRPEGGDDSSGEGAWTGKCAAAWQGAQAAHGEWLLFLDADAVLAPACISTAVAAASAADADLLALMPRARCATVVEAIVQPVMLMLLLWRDDPRRLNDPNDPSAAAPGSFLCFRRAAYQQIGGHRAVRGEVVEDRKLAERVKQGALRLRVLAAPTLIETSRPLALRDLWNGWSRVAPDGLGRRAGAAAFGANIVQTLFLLPYMLAPLGGWLAALAALHLGVTLIVRAQLRAAYGIDNRFAWLQPLGALFAIAVLLRSIVPGAVRWRGREYPA